MGQKIIKVACVLAGAVALVFTILFIGVFVNSKIVCKDVWYNGTTINGVDVSGYTVLQTTSVLPDGNDYVLDVEGRDGGHLQIRSADIDYTINADPDSVAGLFLEQHRHLTFPNSKHELEVDYHVDYDSAALWREVSDSELVKGSPTYRIVSPASARIAYSGDAGTVVIQEELDGNKVKPKKLLAAIEEVLRNGVDHMDISDEGMYPDLYRKPEVTKDDVELNRELKAYQDFVTRYITWDLQMGDSQTMTPEDIYSICSYSDGTVTYDDQMLRDWVEAFCLEYKTTDKERTITNHLGEATVVPAGDYGWWLKYDSTVQQVRDALAQQMDAASVSAYIEDPSEENKKRITIQLEGDYETTAFRKDYENYEDWDPDNFVEVSLAEQMVYVHQNGKVIFSCPTISGKPVPGRETRKGVYFIKEQQPTSVLVGDDYRTEVEYWVRITWTGTGFHAAPWQSWGSWSPTYYQSRGSHGCLNLRTEDAARIFELTKYKEAVFIY